MIMQSNTGVPTERKARDDDVLHLHNSTTSGHACAALGGSSAIDRNAVRALLDNDTEIDTTPTLPATLPRSVYAHSEVAASEFAESLAETVYVNVEGPH